ncbi:SDR family NAD(P)-dependent oxidoreductase [Nonomuraea sp. NPDC050404]|uniref:SDR family NAD(P)-dependent oxidoreductase n=1 Tax=Nonomuraea sp. NPDC050404 TaxID=3155783 RepID=UPI0033EC34B3
MDGTRLDGRVAVVTGAAGAIGAAIARDLTALGGRVVIADVDLAGAREVAGGLPGARAMPLDLASPASVEEFANAVERADILVHNAGVAVVEPFVEGDPAGWDLMWRVNLRGPMLLTKLLLPGMMERAWGRLVFVSSDGARAGSGGEGAYAATKAGLFGLAKTLAREAARAHVTSNVVCPGPVDTPMLHRVADAEPGLVDKIVRGIPLRRLGTPADVAGLVAYLCTERAAYITGQTLSVSGGVTMH